MDLKLQVKQSQILSQRMIQSAEILQMTSQELNTYVNDLALENPVIDIVEPVAGNDQKESIEQQQWLNSFNEENYYLYQRQNNDDDYVASLNNHFKYFNTTTWMANILLGASVAMEEKDGVKALDTVQNFKTGMMGPLAGIGDTLIWVLYPTIMGSIAAYMGLEGNPTGALIWMLLNVIFFFFRIKLFHLGYDSGLKLITTLGDKLSVFTEAASIMGLTVIGALIPSVVKMSLGLVFKSGKVKLAIQTGVLDKIMPALLPVALTFIVYKLLASKKLTVIQVIFLIIILALVCSFFGILAL